MRRQHQGEQMPRHRILLGVIGRPFGVGGLVRVASHTADPKDLTAYGGLTDEAGRRFQLRWLGDGLAEVFEEVGGRMVKIADRSAAEKLTNTRLYVERGQLPEPGQDEFYYADLLGLTAVDEAGERLGEVVAVHDYGAGASLEIARADATSLILPFTRQLVPTVDLAGGQVLVAANDVAAVAEGISP